MTPSWQLRRRCGVLFVTAWLAGGIVAQAEDESAQAQLERVVALYQAQDYEAALRLVRAQPSISSQLIDNLNASIHVRALLMDLFLVDEILKLQVAATSPQPEPDA